MGLTICRKKNKKTFQTLSTPAFSWQGTVISKTGTFAPSCSLILSLGFCFTDTVISETAFAQSLSITPPPPPPPAPPPLSALPSSVLHSFICHPLLPLVFLLLQNTDRDNMQRFQSVLCEDLARPFVSFSIHVMRLKQHGELHYTAKRKEQHNHASKDATLTHIIHPASKMQPKYKSL